MMIQVQEPPATGSAKIVCSYCHHRGNWNQLTKPCQLTKCVDCTFCGIWDKHPEYFNKLNNLKMHLKRKQKEIQELENQAKAMGDFSIFHQTTNFISSKISSHVCSQLILRTRQTNLNLCEMFACCEISLMEKYHQCVQTIQSSCVFFLQTVKKSSSSR